MKGILKRVVAVLCAATLVLGLCLVDSKQVAEAADSVTLLDEDAIEAGYQVYDAAKPGEAPETDIPEGYVFAGWYTDAALTQVLSEEVKAEDEKTVYAKIVPKEVMDVQAQYVVNDGMIANCDEITENATAGTNKLTVATDYKEGNGAYQAEGTDQTRTEITLTDSVDISAYKKGALHFWIKTDYTALSANFTITLKDTNENQLSWAIWETRFISEDWVEIKLYFSNGTITGESFDYKNVNYFCIKNKGTATNAYTTIIDDIRAVSALPGVIIEDCEDKDNVTISNAMQQTLDAQYVHDGTSAYYSDTSAAERFSIEFKEAIDLSSYAEDGTLHFWLYVSESTLSSWKTNGQDLRVQLATIDALNTYKQWGYDEANLDPGWNEISLPLSSITGIDLSKIGRIRMHTSDNFTGNLKLAIDDIRIITSTLDEKMVLDCENISGVTLATTGTKVTYDSEYVHDGTGAYYSNTSSDERFSITFNEAIDLSSYAKDGTLHFWLYVSEDTLSSWKTKGENLRVQLATIDSLNTYKQWGYDEANLDPGWNEISLPLSSITDIDLSRIGKIRMHTGSYTSNLTLAIDDVRVIAEIPEDEYISQSAAVRFVTTVDSVKYAKVGFKITVNKTTTTESTCVYETIKGYDSEGNMVELKPTETFCGKSGYFSTHAVYNIPRSGFAKDISVTPYWVTQDGTTVWGTTETYNVRALQAIAN